MKKKSMAIARKVMVWSLAASMLVATPLTASAAGLNEVYKVEDNAGNEVGDSDNTRTGTVTSTNTNTTVLDKNEGKIEGIVLDETDVNLTLNDGKKNSEKTLTVTILGAENLEKKDLQILHRSITWKSSDTEVVALGNLAKVNDGNTQSMLVKAKAGGVATVTVSLDNYEKNIHFTATANVSVKEYATKLEFSKDYIKEYVIKEGDNGYGSGIKDPRFGYVKHSVDLNAALIKTPATANDEVTFEIVNGYDNKTKRNVTNIAAIDKKGVLTYKKAGWVEIVAVGERVRSATLRIYIEEGNPANKVEIWLDKEGETKKAPAQKPDVSKTDEREIKVVAKLEVGKGADKHWAENDKRNDCTDAVTWSSNKPAIVKVMANGDKATLVPAGVGTAKITAQTSTGKKATLSVKVSATMTGIEITTVNQAIYSGQTLKLTADRYFGEGDAYKNFPGSDGVTWYLVNNNADKKVAQIKKDVFTAKAAVGENPVVRVSVKSAKKYGNPKANVTSSKDLEITLKQADVRKIEVVNGDKAIARVGFTPNSMNKLGKDGTVVINAGNGKTFLVTAYDPDDKTTLPDGTPLATTLNISSNKEKSAIASRDEQGNAVVTAPADAAKGVATITVSGTKATNAAKTKYGAIKAAFKADVKIPAKTIQLTYKKKVVQATLTNKNVTKKQNVTVAATLPKGTTTAAKSIKWKAAVVAADGTQTPISVADGKNGVVKLTEGGYAAGDVIVVNAYIKDTADTKVGATSTIRIPVVTPSKKAAIYNAKTHAPFKSNNKDNKADISLKDNTVLELEPVVDISTTGTANFVPAGENKDGHVAANVTYSVNKKGIVSIVDGKVTGIKAGKVNVKATTSDGKTATLAITVTAE